MAGREGKLTKFLSLKKKGLVEDLGELDRRFTVIYMTGQYWQFMSILTSLGFALGVGKSQACES